jgi:hypothetical protein
VAWVVGGRGGGVSENDGFCCNMNAMTPKHREQYQVLRAKLESSVDAVYELLDGYVLRLRAGTFAVAELAAFVVLETRCCPFLTLIMDRKGDSLALRITGRDGVKDFIRAEFSAIRFE